MKLFRLTKHANLTGLRDPWSIFQNGNMRRDMVVRAEDEERARLLAHSEAGFENRIFDGVQPWLDADYTSCVELTADGDPGVLCSANIVVDASVLVG